MRNLLARGTLGSVFPANVRDSVGGEDIGDFIYEAALASKLQEGMPIAMSDILGTKYHRLRQHALAAFGYERFAAESPLSELDRIGEDVLFAGGVLAFAYVKDRSKPRRYLLSVPPHMKSLAEAIAWTFNIRPDAYQPLIET
jgi:uncharacterized protein DUF6745